MQALRAHTDMFIFLSLPLSVSTSVSISVSIPIPIYCIYILYLSVYVFIYAHTESRIHLHTRTHTLTLTPHPQPQGPIQITNIPPGARLARMCAFSSCRSSSFPGLAGPQRWEEGARHHWVAGTGFSFCMLIYPMAPQPFRGLGSGD